MKKFFFIFIFSLCLFFNMFAISPMAQPRFFKQGLYKAEDLNLPTDITHTIQNTSSTEYAFMMIFDSNQIAQQLMQLNPNSEEYILTPLQPGYQLLLVTNDGVTIT